MSRAPLADLTLLEPWWLWLFLVLLAVRRLRPGHRPAVCFAPLRLAEGLPASARQHLARVLPGLEWLGLALLVLALARPVRHERLPLEARGIDVLLCLDVSSSMAATDLDAQRSRLEVARAAAAAFLRDRPQDRIGLLTFARYPDLVCPLTLDHAALATLLEGVELVEGEGPEDATGIGTAVARAAQVLARSDAPSRIVVLLTDGEENVASAATPEEIAPLHAAQLCEQLGIRVYTVAAGHGRPGADGRWIPVDTTEVEMLARRTGGAFYTARHAGAVTAVYATIDRLERGEFEAPRFRVVERFLPFLAAALLLLAGTRLLHAGILRTAP